MALKISALIDPHHHLVSQQMVNTMHRCFDADADQLWITGPQPEIAAPIADASVSEDYVHVTDSSVHTPPNPAMPELRLPHAADSLFDVGLKYKTQQIIGKGAFGYVVAAECNKTGQKVAIKRIRNATSDWIAALRLLREMRFLRQLRGHPNVITLCDVMISESCKNDQQVPYAHLRPD
jgi:serine/threonine protein kinase